MLSIAILTFALCAMIGGALALSAVSPLLTLPWLVLCALVANRLLDYFSER